MKIVLILLLVYQNRSVEHLMAAGFVFKHSTQDVLRLVVYFLTLHLEVEQKEHMLNPPFKKK